MMRMLTLVTLIIGKTTVKIAVNINTTMAKVHIMADKGDTKDLKEEKPLTLNVSTLEKKNQMSQEII